MFEWGRVGKIDCPSCSLACLMEDGINLQFPSQQSRPHNTHHDSQQKKIFFIHFLAFFYFYIFFKQTNKFGVKFSHQSGLMDNQHRVNRGRRRRNLPAELKVEIVDCFPVENAAHFLANVPNRLIIHHCAPRIRRILKMIGQIAADYAHTLPVADSDGDIDLENGHKCTPEIDIFLRHGAAHCRGFYIFRGAGDGFVGYPVDFIDDLIKYYYETKVPAKAVHNVGIELPLENPAPWPASLVQPQSGGIKVEELEVNNEWEYVEYILRNKHIPDIAFELYIYFEEGGKCYQQMTSFSMCLWKMDVQCGKA